MTLVTKFIALKYTMNKKYLTLTAVLLLVVALSISGVVFYKKKTSQNISKIFSDSFVRQNPERLQNLLVDKLSKGQKDEITKAAMYWITHRFFDNKGDINEIYDFVNSHEETAFLREAEQIYPEIFERVKNKELIVGNSLHNIDATLAYLAYLNIVEKSGYADIATLATLANKGIELSHRLTKFNNPKNVLKDYHFAYIETQKKLSADYAKKAEAVIAEYLDNGKQPLEKTAARDMLVGINQYAQTLVYYKALKVDYASKYTYESLFQESIPYALLNVQELYHYSVFLYLASMVTLDEITSEKASPLLKTILLRKIDVVTPSSPVYRIIHCDKEKATYSCENIRLYAELEPEFKQWLQANGWKQN